MLGKLLEGIGLEKKACANLLGINPDIFAEWVAGSRPIPDSQRELLGSVLGVAPSIFSSQITRRDPEDITPPIWFKFRGDRLTEADREFVVLIRQLAHNVHELESATESSRVAWKHMFDFIRSEVKKFDPPAEQGEKAAELFLSYTGLDSGAVGIGNVLRGHLRGKGLLIIESPIENSEIEGFTFLVGYEKADRPCLFANTHRVGWFRRNFVILHEVCHSIFEADLDTATVDLTGQATAKGVGEVRAQAFARAALVPKRVFIAQATQLGIKKGQLDADCVARLVAAVQAEASVVLSVAVDCGFATEAQAKALGDAKINELAKKYSEHALTADEYFAKEGKRKEEMFWARRTSIPSRPLLLPSSYVAAVVEACKAFTLSPGRAAELLMVDDDVFMERFGSQLPEPSFEAAP